MLLSLMNLKTFFLTNKLEDIKWEEFKPKIIKLEHTKLTKYLYHALMAKDFKWWHLYAGLFSHRLKK